MAVRWCSLSVHSPAFRPSAVTALEFPPSFIQSHFYSFCSHKKTWHTCIDKLLPEANNLKRDWNRTRQKKNCFMMFYSCTWLMMYGLQLYDDWKKKKEICCIFWGFLFCLFYVLHFVLFCFVFLFIFKNCNDGDRGIWSTKGECSLKQKVLSHLGSSVQEEELKP